MALDNSDFSRNIPNTIYAFCSLPKHGNVSLMDYDLVQTLLNCNIQNIFRKGEVSSRMGGKCRNDLRKITV